jgi:hypothetical protein
VVFNGNDAATVAASVVHGEVHWYRLTAQASGLYTLQALTPMSHMATVVGLYSFSGARLAYTSNLNRQTTNDSLTSTLTAGQTYFCGLTNWSNTPGGYYSLTFKGPTLNNTPATATDLGTVTAPLTMSNLYLAGGTSAWYRFTLTSPGDSGSLLAINFRNAQGNLDLKLTDSSGRQLGLSGGTTNGQQLSLNGLAAGTYIAQVFGPTRAGNPNYSLAIVPPAPVTGSSGGSSSPAAGWVMQNLTDPTLQSLVIQDLADGPISRSEMLALFQAVSQSSVISTSDFTDLTTIVSNTTVIGMPDYVRDLAQKVVLGDPANAHYQGQTLGNLQAGSSATQLDELVDKWFLGLDHPLADSTSTYVPVAGTLFGSSISYTDINQGEVGDCYFLAALGALARLNNGSGIRSMFIDNSDNTWTVRFYVNGKPDYVTVDRELPASYGYLFYASMGADVTNPSNILWVALAEKAYAQENESGRLGRSGLANSYDSINGGAPGDATTMLTGRATNWSVLSSPSFSAIQGRFNAGDQVTFVSDDPPADSNIVPQHAYTMIGYNAAAQTVTLYNPWGLAGGSYNGVQCDGVVTLTMRQLQNDFLAWFYIA